MTLLALLLVAAVASWGSAWALGRGGMAARVGALGGVAALAVIAVLAVASATPASVLPDATGAVPGTLWNGALIPGGYLRLVVGLWAGTSILVVGIAWLLRGTAGLRGLLPGSLAALLGATVTLAAATPTLALVGAGATGLASIPVILATPRAAAAGVAAREVRVAVASALVVLAVASIAPVVSRLVLANPDGQAATPGSGAAVAVAFGLLAMAVVVAARVGAIPYHVRISSLADAAPAASLPLVLAWLPLPLAAVSVGVATTMLGPLARPVGSAQALIVALTLLATLAAALAAFTQDDLRHGVGYLAIADLGLVVLAFATFDAGAPGIARTWLLTVAVTKTALAAWSAVVEDRFGTRAVPDLRGWLRSSPVLGLALALIALATYGLPGWAVLSARDHLTGLAAQAPWNTLLLVASLLTLPAYLRWLWLGIGAPTSHVERAVPEFAGGRLAALPARRLRFSPPGRGRQMGLEVEQEASETAVSAPGPRPRRRAEAETGTLWSFDPVAERPAADQGAGGRRVRRLAPSTAPTAPAPEASAPLAEPAEQPVVAAGLHRRSQGVASPDAATRAAEAVRRHRTELLSGAVLVLALLASLVAFGAFDAAGAAAEPTPAMARIGAVTQ